VEFLGQLAARAAVAVENAHLYSERARIADTLQHSLLPDALPDIEGWELASLYRPATAAGGVEVGGDFYDAFRTPSGWMLLIGDVTGKGVEAAAMTSLVRHGARFVSEYASDPAEVLAQLDRALREQDTLSLCTALCLRVEGQRVTFASAGHPLPLMVSEGGVKPVGMPGSVLGAFEDGEWPMTELVLRAGEVLLLYTDGVTDTVGEGDRFGEGRLHATAEECGPQSPEELLACLEQALSRFQVGPQADDTAALALRLAGEAQPAGAVARHGEAGA
jgi:serine phosphatase RsbU (regulator of sigma subunit)